MLKKLAVSIATCCLSTVAYSEVQTCVRTLTGSCSAVCAAKNDYHACTKWDFVGCHFNNVCTPTSSAESLNKSLKNSKKICSATMIGQTFDPGNGDQAGNAFLALNFPYSFSVKNENGQILLKNNDPDCK